MKEVSGVHVSRRTPTFSCISSLCYIRGESVLLYRDPSEVPGVQLLAAFPYLTGFFVAPLWSHTGASLWPLAPVILISNGRKTLPHTASDCIMHFPCTQMRLKADNTTQNAPGSEGGANFPQGLWWGRGTQRSCAAPASPSAADLSGLTNPRFPLPAASDASIAQTASPCCIVASLSSAGIAQALMQPNGEGGQCAAAGTPPQPRACLQHQHSCRSKPSALFPVPVQLLNLHVCKLSLQVLMLHSTETWSEEICMTSQ